MKQNLIGATDIWRNLGARSIEAPARSRSLAGGDALPGGRDLQRLVLPAVIVAEVAALYLVLRGGGWVFDDNLSVELARSNGFTWDWLTANLFGHFEIAHRAMFTLQSDLMPIDYRWALVTMLTLVGVASYLLSRCVQMLTGDGSAPVVASAYFGVSVLLIGPLLWWSTGLEAFPTVGRLRSDGGRRSPVPHALTLSIPRNQNACVTGINLVIVRAR